MTSYAERNRQLKKTIEAAFGRGKVTVRGSRGTSYGWVTVHIAHSPRNWREAEELRSKVWELIRCAKIEIGTYDNADYGSGSEIHINFDHCREQADSWGPDAWKQHMSAADWDAMQAQGGQ